MKYSVLLTLLTILMGLNYFSSSSPASSVITAWAFGFVAGITFASWMNTYFKV